MAFIFQGYSGPVFSTQNQTKGQMKNSAPQKTEVKYKELLIAKIKEILKGRDYAFLRDLLLRMDRQMKDSNGSPLKDGTNLGRFAAYLAGFGKEDFMLRVYVSEGYGDTKKKRLDYASRLDSGLKRLSFDINKKLPGLKYSAHLETSGTETRMWGNEYKNGVYIISKKNGYAFVKARRDIAGETIEERVASSRKLQDALSTAQTQQQQPPKPPPSIQSIPMPKPQEKPSADVMIFSFEAGKYYNSPAELVSSIAHTLDRTFKIRYKYGWDFSKIKKIKPGQKILLDCSSFVGLLLEIAELYLKGSKWTVPRVSKAIFDYFDGTMTNANRLDVKLSKLDDGNVYVGYRRTGRRRGHVGLILKDRVVIGKVDKENIVATLRKAVDLPYSTYVESFTSSQAVLRTGRHGKTIVVGLQGGKATVHLGQKDVQFDLSGAGESRQLVYNDLIFLNLPSKNRPKIQYAPAIKYDLAGKRFRKDSKKRPLYVADTDATFDGHQIAKDKITPESVLQSITHQYIKPHSR